MQRLLLKLLQPLHKISILVFIKVHLLLELLLPLFIFRKHLVLLEQFFLQDFYGFSHFNAVLEVLLLLVSFGLFLGSFELFVFNLTLLKLSDKLYLFRWTLLVVVSSSN